VFADLARVLLPGPSWRSHLRWAHDLLRPGVYAELGNGGSDTIALARPPTSAVAIDPGAAPGLADWDAAVAAALAGRKIDLAFIRGPRPASQTLDALIALEPHCAPAAAIVFTGTLPVAAEAASERAQRPFWLGDVWKLPVCLARWRPDLRTVTIPAPPAGLTVVTRRDARSDEPRAGRETIVQALAALDLAAFATDLPALIQARGNDVGETARALGLRP
jgi:hypothetical protein